MRAWITLTLALAVAVTVPVAAQQEIPDETTTVARTTTTTSVLTQGAFVSHRAGTGELPETVTVRFNWNGTPLLGTYIIRNEDRWMSQGRTVNWATIQPGAMLTIPTTARVSSLDFGGPVGVGRITDIDRTAGIVTVQLPNGESRTLRYASTALVTQDGRQVSIDRLVRGDTVLFQVAPAQNQVALFEKVKPGTIATITNVGNRTLTLRYREGGREYTRTYSLDTAGGTRFFQRGRLVARDVPASFQTGQTVWIFGATQTPAFIVGGVTTGFEAALAGQPGQPVASATPTETMPGEEVAAAPAPETMPEEEVAAAPAPETMPGEEVAAAPAPETMPGEEVAAAPAPETMPGEEVAAAPAPETMPGEEVAVTATPSETVAAATLPAPLNEGQVVAYNPATATSPATVTMQFNWNGTPMLGTFTVSEADRWMYQGQPVDFATLQPGTTLSVPQGAQIANLTFGGPMGVGTVTAVNTANNTVTMRLPNGQVRTLRYSPQAVFIQNGQPVMLSQLTPGTTVAFEVAPQRNMVALFSTVEPGMTGTITSVANNTITVRSMENGQMMTRTYSTDTVRIINRGQPVTGNLQTALRPGQTVYIYGPAEQPQFVASNVQTGFEAAQISAPTTVVAERPISATAGVQQAPRRVIRGRW